MLFRGDIIQILREMDIPIGEYWVSSGAALVLHGVKESTGDIDIGCVTALVERAIARGCPYRIAGEQCRIVEFHPAVELIENWWVRNIVWIGGFPVASLADVRRQKLALGREKDFRDVALIDAFAAQTEP